MKSTDDNDFVKIAVLDNIIEAQMVMSLLDEENIPYLFRSFHDTAYNGLFQFQKGYGEISAPKKFETDIREIIAHIKAAGATRQ
ncbi:MAG: hypothetical protein R6U50_17010 [Desulfobacterales bacterium]